MLLRIAFKTWSQIPDNMNLAKNCRGLVDRILLKKYGDIELEYFNEEFARKIFDKSTEITEYKVKVASILTHVLEWGSTQNYCSKPLYDYHVALPKTPPTPEEAVRKTFIRQLAEDTLRVVAEWESIPKIESELHIKNVGRAIKNKSLAGGFYWQLASDDNPFVPKIRKRKVKSTKVKKVESTSSKDSTPGSDEAVLSPERLTKIDLSKVSNADLLDEMRRRGWKGNVSFTTNVEL